MIDINTVARNARELIARALHVLHAGDDVPGAALDVTMTLAESIAALAPGGRGPDAMLAGARLGDAIGRLREHAASATVGGALVLLDRAASALAEGDDAVPLVAPPDAAAAVKRTELQAPIAAAFADAGRSSGVPASAAPVSAIPSSGPTGTRIMGDAPKIAVALDATGPSNFYHGPGGADVARHGGIFVATDAAWTVGSPVQMVVTVRGGPPFDIMGVVRWTRPRAPNAPAGFGASFLEVGERAEQEIAAFVRSRPPFFYGT